MGSDIELISKIKELRSQGETYEGIGEKMGVSGALIWKVARGLCTSHKARVYFGLPTMVEVEPCRKCGGVHTKKLCTTSYKAGKRKRLAFDIPNDLNADQSTLYKSSMRDHSRLILAKIRNS